MKVQFDVTFSLTGEKAPGETLERAAERIKQYAAELLRNGGVLMGPQYKPQDNVGGWGKLPNS